MPKRFSTKGLAQIKVGDRVGPIRTTFGGEQKWTGVLRTVTKVTEKRFLLNSDWFEKDTGRAVSGGGGSFYVLATAEMIAKVEEKRMQDLKSALELAAFHQREDYKLACAVWDMLDGMTPERNPLDRLPVEEWQALFNKLTGQVPQ